MWNSYRTLEFAQERAETPFSLEAWILPSTLNTEYRGVLSNQSDDDAGRDGYLIYIQADAGLGPERWSNGMSNPIASPASVRQATWAHVVGSYDGALLTLYVNGAVVAGPAASNLSIPAHPGCSFAIGAMFCGTVGFFAGTMDEVAICDHALTPARVLVHYRVGEGESP